MIVRILQDFYGYVTNVNRQDVEQNFIDFYPNRRKWRNQKTIYRDQHTAKVTESANMVVNLTDKEISYDQQRVLNMGLSFVRANREFNREKVFDPLRKAAFYTFSPIDTDNLKTTMTSLFLQCGHIEKYETLRPNTSYMRNLTKKEHDAIQDLINDDSIVIKPADKGGNVVLWSTDEYLNEAKRQLSSQSYVEVLREHTTPVCVLSNKQRSTIRSHLQFLMFCADNRISLKTLRLRKSMCVNFNLVNTKFAQAFQSEWNYVLTKASRELQSRLLKFYTYAYRMDPQKCDYDINAYKYMLDQKLHKLSWMMGRQVSAEELNHYEPCARRTFHQKQSQSNNSCSNLTDVDLSESKVAVLNLGLNFNITPREYSRYDLITQLKNVPTKLCNNINECDAITNLRNRSDIVISKADKGPEAVLWKKSDYNEEALRQLQTQAYKVASKDDFIESIQQVNDLLDEFVMKRVSSYVRNTYDFVGKVTKMSLNENDIICTIDVEGLYSNIPIVEGINSVHYAMQEAGWEEVG
ncbi:hypothetical protein GJ496_007890, partial [Pomphorhynchus laevis]